MKPSALLLVLITLLGGVAWLDCQPGGASVADLGALPDLAPECLVGGDGGPPATLAAIQAGVFDVYCVGCHDTSAAVPLVAGAAWGNLVGKPTQIMEHVDESCGGTLVVPGDPARSYLFHKISEDAPCAGRRMPLSEFGDLVLPDCRIDEIRRWILAGAPP